MAKINFDSGEVYDNTLTGTARFTIKAPGFHSTGRVMAYAPGGRLRALEAGVTAASGVGAGKTLRLLTGTFDFDSSYPTGGEAADAIGDFFPGGIVGVMFVHPNVAAARTVAYDVATKKILAYTDGFVTQVAAATNLSAVTGVRFIAWGW